jgi:predicted RNase H-like HicB family nuclease
MSAHKPGRAVRSFPAVIERCTETELLVGHVPGFPGAHSQGETLDELQANLQEVIAMLLEDGDPALESNFVGLQQAAPPFRPTEGAISRLRCFVRSPRTSA